MRALSLISCDLVWMNVGLFVLVKLVSTEPLLKREVVLPQTGHRATCFEKDAKEAGVENHISWKKASAKDISSSILSSEHSWNWDPLFFTEVKYCLSANWQYLFSLKDIIT